MHDKENGRVCQGGDALTYDDGRPELPTVSFGELDSTERAGLLAESRTPFDWMVEVEFHEFCQLERAWWERLAERRRPGPRTKYCSDCGEQFVDCTKKHTVFRCATCGEKSRVAQEAKAGFLKTTHPQYCLYCGIRCRPRRTRWQTLQYQCWKCVGVAAQKLGGTCYCVACGRTFCFSHGGERFCDACKEKRKVISSPTERFCVGCGNKLGTGVVAHYCEPCELPLHRKRWGLPVSRREVWHLLNRKARKRDPSTS